MSVYIITLNPTKLLSRGSRPPTLQVDRAVSKWTRVGAPQPFTTCKWDTGRDLGSTTGKWTRVAPPPPNPSRVANRQGLGAPPTPHDLGRQGPNPSRLANGQGLGTPTLHDLQMDKGWGPPTPHDLGRQPFTTCNLQMDKGWPPQPFTTCKWTRVGGPPTPHDLGRQGTPTLHDLQMDKVGAPKPLTTWGGRGPQPFRT